MSLKSQVDQTFRAGFVLLVFALIACAECVLIAENAAFLQAQGKTPISAFALASCAALLIPVASAFRVSGRNSEPHLWAFIGKWSFVSSLVAMQVWFASQAAIAPQMQQVMSESDKALISEYQAQIQQYDTQIAEFQKRIDAYSDKYRSRKAELSGEQAALVQARKDALSELRTIAENAGAEPAGIQAVFKNTTIAATIAYRLALEIGVIFLSVILRSKFAAMPELSRHDAETMRPAKPALIPANAPEVQAVPRIETAPALESDPDAETESVNPREYVMSLFPNAVCKSANGRKGPFAVYADESERTLLGKSRSNVDAWESAARRIREGRAA